VGEEVLSSWRDFWLWRMCNGEEWENSGITKWNFVDGPGKKSMH
jgi:hypothetical protein